MRLYSTKEGVFLKPPAIGQATGADIIDGDVHRRRAPGLASSSASYSRRASLTLLAFLLASAFALSACGEKREPKGASTPLFPVSVRDADHSLVTLERAPEEIAIAGQAPSQLASSLALSTRNVGDRSGNLDLGLIRKLKPDLLLAGSEIDSAALRQARGLEIAVYVVPDRSLDGIEQALSDVGLLTGRPLHGRAVRAQIAKARARVREAIASTRPVRVFFDTGEFATVSTGSFIGSIIKEAGGIDVAGPDPNEGPFPLLRLHDLKPEVFVVASDVQITLAELRRNRLLKWLPAIRNGRLIRVNMQLLEPGPEAVAALQGLARAFHPDAFR
jgi:ABC-type Fe3+-hydroxamate transport system substrate-binding protein